MANINIKTLIGNGEMATDHIFTEAQFEWFKSDEDGYIYTRNTETGRNTRFNAEGQNGKRISDAEYFTKCNEALERAEARYVEECEAEEAIETREQEELVSEGKLVNYKGNLIPVRGGAWNDPMNSCFYTVDDTIWGYEICTEISNGEVFAIENPNAEPKPTLKVTGGAVEFHEAAEAPKTEEKPKKQARKAKKNAAFRTTIDGTEITLTDKQVDFIRHLPDTHFWEDGVNSVIWVDCLCDDIGGQFEGKPMTVGAMISTICEKGLGVRGKQKVNGRKATSFQLTDAGKQVARTLGLF